MVEAKARIMRMARTKRNDTMNPHPFWRRRAAEAYGARKYGRIVAVPSVCYVWGRVPKLARRRLYRQYPRLRAVKGHRFYAKLEHLRYRV